MHTPNLALLKSSVKVVRHRVGLWTAVEKKLIRNSKSPTLAAKRTARMGHPAPEEDPLPFSSTVFYVHLATEAGRLC